MRLIPLGHLCAQYTVFEAGPRVEADEINKVGAKQQQLRHPCIVVARGAQMAITAGLGLRFSGRMRKVRVHGLRTETTGGNRWLLHIDALAIGVG